MSKTVIEVENLSKLYRLGAIGATTFKESFQRFWYRLRRREDLYYKISKKHLMISPDDPQAGPEPNTIWALKDVSFSVNEGEIIGIIGNNGSGKSTLLKILSRITAPTKGKAIIRGRVGSLLEVGTGFHQELTGRENIYLNGTILGMRKKEVDKIFDEIVSFAEIDKFIDTPVKHYSSGMYVRLAFAVAAHLRTEILLVDEVLAVGDAAFQKKCLGKMGEVAKEGRTVLFVSHNMGAVGSLCEKTILFKSGRIEMFGPSSEIIMYYLDSELKVGTEEKIIIDDDGLGYKLIRGQKEIRIICGQALFFSFDVICPKPCCDVTSGLVIYDIFGNPVVGMSSKFQGISGKGNGCHWRIHCNIGEIPLNDGHYKISVWFGTKYKDYTKFSDAFSLYVLPSDPFRYGNKVPDSWGHFFWKPQWDISLLE